MGTTQKSSRFLSREINTSSNWKFDDAPDSACFTTTFVLQGSPILRVYHDYDGDWQFNGAADQLADESVMKVVALEQVVNKL